MQEKTYLKVVLLGKVNSGKTCLVTRYITRSFSEETPSLGTSPPWSPWGERKVAIVERWPLWGGGVNSGKTCLVIRYIWGFFTEEVPSTIGAAFCRKDLYIQGRNLSLAIWDTAGAERYQAMSAMYYRSARAAIICFDLTDSSSFDKAKYWVGQLKSAEPDCKIYLCGTKLDLIEEARQPREVTSKAITNYGREVGGDVFETSSKRGYHVDKVFEKIAEDFMKNNKMQASGPKGDLQLERSTAKKSCC